VLRTSSPTLEERADAAGPPLTPGALQRGGMGVFEKQAACPFRAFAEYRLGARALEEPVLGLTPQERGKVLHAALENIWRELRTHAALVALATEARADLVARAIAAALAEQLRGRGIEAMPHVQVLEARRLERLLAAWLDVEALRSPFEVVASERQRAITLGGLSVDIQVDRLDWLPGGGFAIIDYKTGAVSPAHWEGERPDAPQLPLYAATLDEPVGAVLFAHLAAGDLRFRGLQEGAGVPQATEYSLSKAGKASGGTLADHIAEWRRVLENLGRQFAAGAAAVSPKTPQSCLHCDLPALCRVGGLAAEVEDAPEPRHE
jgi:probable DNA repair protein